PPSTPSSLPFPFIFFFFQAEDGIRAFHVTGVQTCALPIWSFGPLTGSRQPRRPCCGKAGRVRHCADPPPRPGNANLQQTFPQRRSEERRVGKECRYRRSPHHQEQKKNTER